MKRYLILLLLFLVVGCSNVPQSGNVSVDCGYVINADKSVTLNCLSTLPATFTPVPTATATATNTPTATLTPTLFVTPTQIVSSTPSPTSSPSQLPTPTGTLTITVPVPTPGFGFPINAVIRNGFDFAVRVRDCKGMSEANPITCPQAKIQGKDANNNTILVDFMVQPSTAFRIWRVHYPTNNGQNVWGAISSDAATNRFWAAICYQGNPLLHVYYMGGYTPEQDILAIWWSLFQAGTAPAPQNCTYPVGG